MSCGVRGDELHMSECLRISPASWKLIGMVRDAQKGGVRKNIGLIYLDLWICLIYTSI